VGKAVEVDLVKENVLIAGGKSLPGVFRVPGENPLSGEYFRPSPTAVSCG